MAAQYARKNEKSEEATTFLKSGMQANPTSLLLHYAYIEMEESKANISECHKVYGGLIARLQAQIDGVTASIQTETQQALEDKAKVEQDEAAARRQQGQMEEDDEDNKNDGIRFEEREAITKAIAESKAPKLEELKRLAANVWIMQMRFARRAEVSGDS